MDGRFQPTAIDCTKTTKVILHPTAEMRDIRNGTATDGFDLSPFVSDGTQRLFETQITLNWNNELFGANQPKPNQIIEIQQQGITSWVGIIESLSSYIISRGERQMEVTAKSRDSLNLWRETKLLTNAYPTLTDLAAIINDIALKIGLYQEEIAVPSTGITTAHSNTQLAGLSAMDCFNALMTPMGMTPFVDCLGRLRGASRDLRNRPSDIVLTNERVVQVNASRLRAPTTRVRVQWLDPVLQKCSQSGRKLGEATITTGWFIPYIQKEIWFSADKTQRAENTYLRVKQSANGLGIPVCLETYSQTSDSTGEIRLINLASAPTIALMVLKATSSSLIPDWVAVPPTGGYVPTTSVGRKIEALATQAIFLILMSVGTGVYEIWGNPYDWIHARNTTEAFDQNAPGFIDDPVDIESDFVMNEQHAQNMAVRELFYRSYEASSWSARLIEDLRIEYGDIIEFPDGTRMYALDVERKIQRDSDSTVTVSGFLVPAYTPTQTNTGSYTISGTITKDAGVMGGVTVVLTGAGNATTTTDSQGNFSFPNLGPGNYYLTPSYVGYTFNPTSLVATIASADVTGENFVASQDAGGTHNISGNTGIGYVNLALSGSATGTAISDGSGNYEFSGLPSAGTYTVTPSKSGYAFNPASITVSLNNGSVTGESFSATAV